MEGDEERRVEGRGHEGERKEGRKEKRGKRGRRTYSEFTGNLRFRGLAFGTLMCRYLLYQKEQKE